MPGIDRVVTHGTFELDGGSWEVDAVRGRNVVVVVCTHGHNDHVTVAPQLAEALDAVVLLHPADEMLCRMAHPDADFRPLQDGEVLTVGGTGMRAIHTPGHRPGSTCLHAPELGAMFSGDALFQGGPGATGRSYSDDPRVDLPAAGQAAPRNGRLHRARRHHHNRRRAGALRRMGDSGALEPRLCGFLHDTPSERKNPHSRRMADRWPGALGPRRNAHEPAHKTLPKAVGEPLARIRHPHLAHRLPNRLGRDRERVHARSQH